MINRQVKHDVLLEEIMEVGERRMKGNGEYCVNDEGPGRVMISRWVGEVGEGGNEESLCKGIAGRRGERG